VSRNKFIADDNRLDKPVLLSVSHLPDDLSRAFVYVQLFSILYNL